MSSLQLEIEAKYKISRSQITKLRRYMKENHFLFEKSVQESDTYYSRPDVDFMRTRECLRIRRTSSFSELTYKPGSTREMHQTGMFWKRETNVDITGREDDMHSVLMALGSIELVTVVKKRQVFKKGSVVVALDDIKNLGTYIEIEIITNKKNKQEALCEIETIAKMLQLETDSLVRLPYRDILMKVKA